MNRPRLYILFVLSFALCHALAQQPQPSPADVEKRVEAILSKMTLEQKIDYIGGQNDMYLRAVSSAGVPRFKMSDGPIGLRDSGPATTLAGGIALAATWDTELARRTGVVLGADARARGVHFLLGPGVNIYRAPMAGRDFEYFGEDPFLASRMAVNYIEGVQSQGVCATVKHFMGNNQEYDRHNVDSVIDERTMREIYLPAFESAVKEAHTCAVMDSYNLTNGQHMSQNGLLNNDLLKKEWGFDGVLMSDWTSTYDGVAAANGGLDLEMPSGDHMNSATLLPAIKDGKVSEATINEHVRRVLRKAVQFGWFDRKQTDLSIPLYNREGRSVALQAAREGIVLLKNNGGLLPLDKAKTKVIAVVGPDAYPAQPVGGGSAAVRPFAATSYMEGLAALAQSGLQEYATKILYRPGLPSLSEMADSSNFTTELSGGKPGLKSERFTSKDLTGTPDTALDEHLNFGFNWPWYSGLPTVYRSARWTGYYAPPQSGTYDVFIQGPGEEGSYRMFLDDKLVIDNWDKVTAQVNFTTLNLATGPHKILLEFRRPWGDSNVRLGIVNTASLVDDETKDIMQNADAVVVCVGFDNSSEGEGSDRTFRLPPGQDELIKAAVAANKNVIVVVTSGGAVDTSAWLDRVPALLQAWYPGEEGGTALAQLIYGEYSPSGKLPASFERRFEDNPVYKNYYADPATKKVKYDEGIFLGYRHYDRASIKPLFPFGFGLSYTKFAYSNLTIAPKISGLAEPITVTFDVKNTGSRDGDEVAQLYIGAAHARVPRPVKELKGFSRVSLKSGETKRVTLTLDRRAFSYYDVAKKSWIAEPGAFSIVVGSSSDKPELQESFTLTR